MKIKEILKNFGKKNAEYQVDSRTHFTLFFQPKLPAKLQEKMDLSK
jgi:hypothetical protein